jgi:hypothetical protein
LTIDEKRKRNKISCKGILKGFEGRNAGIQLNLVNKTSKVSQIYVNKYDFPKYVKQFVTMKKGKNK